MRSLRGRGVEGHEVVVVKIHAVGAQPGQALDGDDRISAGRTELAERIAPSIANGPQTKRELVCGFRV